MQINLPDAFIHPRSNKPAHGHAGRLAEVKLFHLIKYRYDEKVRWATKNENIYKKYDIVSTEKTLGKIDVKAEKEALSKGTIWIEYQNGDGKPGWVFGEADNIVFDLYTQFVGIPRDWLLNLTSNLTKGYVFAGDQEARNRYVSKDKALYRPYRRYKRKDILTKISVQDLLDHRTIQMDMPYNWITPDLRTDTD